MSLTTTKTSGSVEDFEIDIAVPVEDGNDLLRLCAGKCGKKILFFGFPGSDDWAEGVEGALCVECRSKPLKHIPKEK